MSTCKVEGCKGEVGAKELCKAHYQRTLRKKPLDATPINVGRKAQPMVGGPMRVPQEVYDVLVERTATTKRSVYKEAQAAIVSDTQKELAAAKHKK